MGEWISVEDRLPERGQNVIAFSESDGIVILTCFRSAGWKEVITKENAQIIITHEVTHWMPLPEPPNDI